MVTLKEYEAYLNVKRFIDGHDEAEIISRLMGDNKGTSNPIIQPHNLSLKVLNALLAPSLIGLET